MCDCSFPLLRVVVVCLFTEREVIAGGRRRSFIAAGSARRVRFRDSMSNGACGAEYAARSNTSSSILGNRSQKSQQQTRRHPDNNYGWHCVGRRTGEALFSTFWHSQINRKFHYSTSAGNAAKYEERIFTQRMLLNCQLKEFGASASWRC